MPSRMVLLGPYGLKKPALPLFVPHSSTKVGVPHTFAFPAENCVGRCDVDLMKRALD